MRKINAIRKMKNALRTMLPFFMLMFFFAKSQADNTVDSLYQLVEEAEGIEDKVVCYENLLTYLTDADGRLSLVPIYQNELKILAQNKNSTKGLAVAEHYLGAYYHLNRCFHDAINAYSNAKNYYSLIEITPNFVKVCGNLIACFWAIGKQKEAKHIIDEVAAIDKINQDENITVNIHAINGVYCTYSGQFVESITHFDKAISLCRSLDNKALLAKNLVRKGGSLMLIGDTTAASVIQMGVKVYEEIGNLERALASMNQLGRIYLTSGDYQSAVHLAYQQLNLALQLEQYISKLNAYRYLGKVYSALEDEEKTIENYHKSIELSKYEKDTMNWQYTNALLGFFLTNLKQYEKAKPYIESSLSYFRNLPEPSLIATLLNHLVDYYIHDGNITKAKKYAEEAIMVNKDQSHLKLHETYVRLGSIYNKIGVYDEAKKYLIPVYNYGQDYENYTLQTESSHELYKLYKKTNNATDALKWLEINRVLEDSASQAANARKITTLLLETEFAQEKETLALEQAQQEALLKAETKQSRIIAIAIGLLALLGFGFFWNARGNNKRIAVQNEKITRQNEQLEHLNTTKDRIFAIIGHDLRKPAINFRGITKKVNYLLQNKDFKTLSALGSAIEKDALALSKLTDNLLNWALTQKNVLPYHPVSLSLHEVAEEIILLFQQLTADKELKIINRIPEDLTVFADLKALQSIIRNLLDNAVKYSNIGGQIELTATANPEGVKIDISDNGIGIPREQLQDIFLLQKDKSTQGTAGEKGTGLGLHLVKELVSLNKGTIAVKSELGKGTTFEVALPVIV